MTDHTHQRHPAVEPMQLRMLHCGCKTCAPGHIIHMIQARVFSKCPPEDVHTARVSDVDRNEFTVTYDGEEHRAWHSSHAAVAKFCEVATSENAVVAKFNRGNILAAYDGEESVGLSLAWDDGARSPCDDSPGGHDANGASQRENRDPDAYYVSTLHWVLPAA